MKASDYSKDAAGVEKGGRAKERVFKRRWFMTKVKSNPFWLDTCDVFWLITVLNVKLTFLNL